MPSKSKKQRNWIFHLRGKYKTQKNTPEKYKWIWEKEWEQIEEDRLKRYKPILKEALSPKERERIKKEIDELDLKIKKSAFVDPIDFRRKDELFSLLLSDGESTQLRLAPGKSKKSRRVTSFTRDRR